MITASRKVVFIGEFPPPYGGVTIKDSLLRDEFFNGDDFETFDLYAFKRAPLRFPLHCVSLLGSILGADRIALGIGSNSRLDYLLRIISMVKGRSFLENVTIFMMGRELPGYLAANRGRLGDFSTVHCIYVESNSLVTEFAGLGCPNARYLPNFRNGDGACEPKPVGDTVHFVFFAQVRPEKGIDTLADAALALNAEGYADTFDIDVFGRVIDDYKSEFENLVERVPNMAYKGLVDAASVNIYAILNQYDAAVSSSSWQEGMSGSNIECKFAGIANIVSDAGFNSECVHDGVDGILVEPRDVSSLVTAMRSVIDNPGLLAALKMESYRDRAEYDLGTWKKEVLDVVCN